jgi:hypothetical protein
MFYIVENEFHKNILQQQHPFAQHISTLRRKVIVVETGAESEEMRVKGPWFFGLSSAGETFRMKEMSFYYNVVLGLENASYFAGRPCK